MSSSPPDVLSKAFETWLATQRKAFELICAADQPGTGPDWAEGFRSLTRMTSLALEHVVEKGDPAFPVLFASQNSWSKLIGDNRPGIWPSDRVATVSDLEKAQEEMPIKRGGRAGGGRGRSGTGPPGPALS